MDYSYYAFVASTLNEDPLKPPVQDIFFYYIKKKQRCPDIYFPSL